MPRLGPRWPPERATFSTRKDRISDASCYSSPCSIRFTSVGPCTDSSSVTASPRLWRRGQFLAVSCGTSPPKRRLSVYGDRGIPPVEVVTERAVTTRGHSPVQQSRRPDRRVEPPVGKTLGAPTGWLSPQDHHIVESLLTLGGQGPVIVAPDPGSPDPHSWRQ